MPQIPGLFEAQPSPLGSAHVEKCVCGLGPLRFLALLYRLALYLLLTGCFGNLVPSFFLLFWPKLL